MSSPWIGIVVATALLASSCVGIPAHVVSRGDASSSQPAADGLTTPAQPLTPSSADCGSSQLDDAAWARCALSVLGLVNTAVRDYHDATALPRQSLKAQTLRQQAFGEFNAALSANQSLWPATQQVHNGEVRDQFVFVLGNIGGFMNPTPDIPGDPNGPTLGDRVARSLQNAVRTSAAVQPELQRLAEGH